MKSQNSSAIPVENDNPSSAKKKMDKKTRTRKERLEKVVGMLPNSSLKINTVIGLLSLLLPFLRALLDENAYRYTLGMIAFHCTITTKQLCLVAQCCKKTVMKGKKEFREGIIPDFTRQRNEGAGRKHILDSTLRMAILKYVRLRSYGPCTKGMQEYSAATLSSIRAFLQDKYHVTVSRSAIQAFLKEQDIRLRTNKKLLYGNQGKETDAQKTIRHSQFELIYKMIELIKNPNFIVLFMDCKKKEILGNLKCTGKTYTFKSEEVISSDHDYLKPLTVATLKDMDDLLDRMEGKAIPFGFYDAAMSKAYINVGISHDTPEFIAWSLLRFFDRIKADHPGATELILFCDGGGSNNARSHVFKKYVEEISSKIGMKVTVIHYPPYRSKFNWIERRVFAPISKKFERSMLFNLRTVLALINSTTTQTGLTCIAELDSRVYSTGVKITDEQYEAIAVTYLSAPNGVTTGLAYTIDGIGKKTEYLDKIPPTVFEIKQNIDLSKKEKEELAKQKAERQARNPKKTGNPLKPATTRSQDKKSDKPA